MLECIREQPTLDHQQSDIGVVVSLFLLGGAVVLAHHDSPRSSISGHLSLGRIDIELWAGLKASLVRM